MIGAINALNTSLTWKSSSSVSGGDVLALPISGWVEAVVIFEYQSNPRASIYYFMINRCMETHHTAWGYLAPDDIYTENLPGSPRQQWVHFYNHNNNFFMMNANAEDGVENYKMTVWYR